MTEGELARGRWLLRQLLPAARKRMHACQLTGQNKQFASIVAWIRPDMLEAMVIHPGVKGGWEADLVLSGVPSGMPNIIGSNVHAPFPTQSAAEAYAGDLLAGVLNAANVERGASVEPDAIFELFDVAITIPREVLATFGADPAYREVMVLIGKDIVMRRVAEKVARLLPDGVTLQSVEALPQQDKLDLMGVIAAALLCEVIRYPPAVPMPAGA